MIDKEQAVYDAVSSALRETFDNIFITGTELVNVPSQFPAVYIIQKNSEVNKTHSTFDKVDNVAAETDEFGIYSNLESERLANEQTKKILSVIDGVMSEMFYPRTFCQPIPCADTKFTRRVARYKKTNVTMED